MGGGLMQLVAYGAQDTYLTGSPQITFFKVVYRRHTNFAVEPIQQTWNGVGDFGRTVTCNINRNGDLITNMYVVVSLKDRPVSSVPWGYVNRLGHAICSDIKIEIGGSTIDEQYGDWLNIWYELSHKAGQESGYAKMIGDVPALTNISSAAKNPYRLYIPLQFWFNRNTGLALPLIALQYHDVRITLIFRKALDCINYQQAVAPDVQPEMSDSYLLIDYVYLDSEERKRFAQASHEYLIEQLQFTGSESLTSNSNKYRLNFNHPSKYLVWVPHLDRYYNRKQWISYAFDGNWQNAKDRFAKILYVASRGGFASSASSGDAFTSGSTSLWVVNPGGFQGVPNSQIVQAAGDLFETTIDPNISASLRDILSKIEVKLISQSDPDSVANYIKIGSGATPTLLLQDLLNNVIVTRNDLTSEDISITADYLISPGGLNSIIVNMASYSIVNYHNYSNFIDGTDNPVVSAKIQLNGHDRFQDRDGMYFNYVQPYQHFTNTPADGINVYSFALKPEEHQPSGTCNFSRIDNTTLQIQLGKYNSSSIPGESSYSATFLGNNSASLLNIYTTNYNILRVTSGMGGLAYSN
jgi:hypothetical protein